MISTKCDKGKDKDKCKDKAWCWSCNECQSKLSSCLVCHEIIKYRERHNHMVIHYNDLNQYLICKKYSK